MSGIINSYKYNGIYEFIVDTEDDLNNLPLIGIRGKKEFSEIESISQGSTVLIISGLSGNTEVKILNSQNQWVAMGG